MIIPEERGPVKEYSVDDESIKNIMHELKGDEGLHDYIVRISELIESVESKKINSLINYLLYGMIINDGLNIESISNIYPDLNKCLEEYYKGLDEVETALSTSKKIEANNFPQLVDCLRMDKDFYKKNKKEIDSYLKVLPDIKKSLEKITSRAMGLS